MQLYFSDLITSCQTELITAALAIAHRAAKQSQSKAAQEFLTAYHHAVVDDQIFESVDIQCGKIRALRILAGASGKGA